MTHAEKIAALKTLLAEGRFHHATHRTGSGLWNGLWIYENDDPSSPFPYKPALCFYDSEGRAQQDEAYSLVRHTGISVGARGQG